MGSAAALSPSRRPSAAPKRGRPAFSSNGSTRPANSTCGPSGPENQRSNSLRFFPAGFSRIPRLISAIDSAEINRSSSACSAIHATRPSEGTGLVTLLIILASRRLRLTGQPCGPASPGDSEPDRRRPEATGVMRALAGETPCERPDQLPIGVASKNLESGHAPLVEALPIVVQRSFLRRCAHGGS